MSVEFVAEPQEAHRVEASIPAAIDGALNGVTGFAGCLVLISDQEARLVTVVTLWVGEDRMKHCRQNARWVDALLAPYLDRHLRVQTMIAHLQALPTVRPEAMDVSVCFTVPDGLSEEEAVCVG